MDAIAIIPARGGSTRIPGKNIRLFHGKPIIIYSIEAAIRSGLFTYGVWVSTDSPEITKIAWDAGAKVHPRWAPLAANGVGTQEVMRTTLMDLFPGEATRPEYACCIYATAPFMTCADLRLGLGTLEARVRPYIYTVGPDGRDAGQWHWGQTSAFINGVPLEGNSYHFPLPEERTYDINTLDDWIMAERLYEGRDGQ
jgi:N-acylneuraminate cytidylyltransferase